MLLRSFPILFPSFVCATPGSVYLLVVFSSTKYPDKTGIMEEIQGPWLASAMGIFFGWSFLAWLVRVWAKLRTQAWTLDDYAISGAVVCVPLSLCYSHRESRLANTR